MWPFLLDMTKEESMQHLRCLEINAFSGLISALRAQGSLDNEKLKLIKDTGALLHISQERHKAEIRRVVNDEKLNTIAYHVNGEKHSTDEWLEEGKRLIPILTRVAPQTAYAAIADEVADNANKLNKQLPNPASTERKRPSSISPTHSNASTSDLCSKTAPFRLSEPELKKRKLSLNIDNCNLSQHLMGPPKISKIQQIYRQKTKAKQKEQQLLKIKPPDVDMQLSQQQQQQVQKPFQQQQLLSPKVQSKILNAPKVNILQNVSIPPPSGACDGQKNDIITNDIAEPSSQPSSSLNENQPKLINKLLASSKLNQLTIKASTGGATTNDNVQKTIKVCATRKIASKTVTTSSGQKLIVVSNPQPLTSSSILQRTLTTIPFKNISVKNLDKFKLVTSTTNSSLQSNVKQKVVTVRTSANKKMIPLSQVQVLNTKSGIKVVPLDGKIIGKAAGNTQPNSVSVHIVNDVRKSAPILISNKLTPPEINNTSPDTSTNVPLIDDDSISNNDTVDFNAKKCVSEINEFTVPDEENITNNDHNSNNDHHLNNDITNQSHNDITNQSHNDCVENDENVNCDVQQVSDRHACDKIEEIVDDAEDDVVVVKETNGNVIESSEKVEAETEQQNKVEEDENYYIIDDEPVSENVLVDDIEMQEPVEVLNVVGCLDPITGQYSVTHEQNNVSLVESRIVKTETTESDLNVI